MEWHKQTSDSGRTLISALEVSSDEKTLQQTIEAAIDTLLERASADVNDASRFMLFHWDANSSHLSVTIADDRKQANIPQTLCLQLPGVAEAMTRAENPEHDPWGLLKYWIKDYLTVCKGFLQFSLIAVFYTETPDRADLL